MTNSNVAQVDSILYGVTFVIASLVLICLWFFESWRDVFRWIGLRRSVAVLVMIMGISAYLIETGAK